MSTSGGSSGGGSGTVTSVTATDTSIVVSGTPTVAPTLATGTLDVIATDHPPAANWSNNSHKITALANGSAAQDAAAFGQVPLANTVAADIQPLGIAAAGALGTWADAEHVHPNVAPGAILASLSYNPAGNNTYTTSSATLTAVDATNLAPTVTVPPSGQVWVWGDAVIDNSVNVDLVVIGFLIAAAQAGPLMLTSFSNNPSRIPYSGLITGLTPGASVTIALAWQVAAGSARIAYGAGSTNAGPVNMRVSAA